MNIHNLLNSLKSTATNLNDKLFEKPFISLLIIVLEFIVNIFIQKYFKWVLLMTAIIGVIFCIYNISSYCHHKKNKINNHICYNIILLILCIFCLVYFTLNTNIYIQNTHQTEKKVYDIIKTSIKKYNAGYDKKTIMNDSIIELEKYSKKISSITGDNSTDNIYVLANIARLYYESENPEKAKAIINSIDVSYILADNHNDSNDCALCSYNLVKGLIYQSDGEYLLSDDCFKKIKNHIKPSDIYNDIFYQQAMVNLMKNAYIEPKSYVDIANIVNEYSNLIHTIQVIDRYHNMNPAYNICNIDFLIYETLWRRDNDMEYISLLNCLNIWYDNQSLLFSADAKMHMYFLSLGTPLSSKYKNIVINEVDMDEKVKFYIESLYNITSNNASLEEKEEYINNLYRLNINTDTIYTLKYLNALVILYMSYDELDSAYNNLTLMQENIDMLDYNEVNTIKAQQIIIDFNYLFYIYYKKINDEQAIQYYNKAETIYKKIYNKEIPENYLMKYLNANQ